MKKSFTAFPDQILPPPNTPMGETFNNISYGDDYQYMNDVVPAPQNWVPLKNTVLIATVALTAVTAASYWYHLAFVYRCGRRCLDYEFRLANLARSAIDISRNYLAKVALENRCEFIFFYDTDTHLHPDLMQRLLEVMKLDESVAAVAPIYHVRSYPFGIMALEQSVTMKTSESIPKKELLRRADENGLADVEVIGNGCTLIRTEAFTKWPGPWFRTTPINTEDAWFCTYLKKVQPKGRIVIDTTIECGHELSEPLVACEGTAPHLKKAFEPGGWYYKTSA